MFQHGEFIAELRNKFTFLDGGIRGQGTINDNEQQQPVSGLKGAGGARNGTAYNYNVAPSTTYYSPRQEIPADNQQQRQQQRHQQGQQYRGQSQQGQLHAGGQNQTHYQQSGRVNSNRDSSQRTNYYGPSSQSQGSRNPYAQTTRPTTGMGRGQRNQLNQTNAGGSNFVSVPLSPNTQSQLLPESSGRMMIYKVKIRSDGPSPNQEPDIDREAIGAWEAIAESTRIGRFQTRLLHKSDPTQPELFYPDHLTVFNVGEYASESGIFIDPRLSRFM